VNQPAVETASWGRRILALLVDWLGCTLVVQLAIGVGLVENNPFALYTMALFILENTVFTTLLGGSFGKLATRLRVVRVDGSAAPVDLLHSVLRSVLIALVIPPLVFRPDGRGLHDMAAGTATVTLQTALGTAS
jgi:uncharacterized RDD family membrane protein YckC